MNEEEEERNKGFEKIIQSGLLDAYECIQVI